LLRVILLFIGGLLGEFDWVGVDVGEYIDGPNKRPLLGKFEVIDERNTLGIKEALNVGFNRGGGVCAVFGSLDGSIPG